MMITILFCVTVKAECEDEWRGGLAELQRSTRASDAGCLTYTFYRQVDSPREYVLVEQWADADALAAHLARLQHEYGPPPDGLRLPAAILDFFERADATHYEPAL